MEAAIGLKPLKIGNLVAKHPVIQGGMGVGVSLSSLAGAVAKAGGIGIISTAQIGFKDQDFGKNPMAATPDGGRQSTKPYRPQNGCASVGYAAIH